MKKILAVLIIAFTLQGCVKQQMNRIVSEAEECSAPLKTEPQFAVADAILKPDGGKAPRC